MEIYLDVLFLENLIMNYFILQVTAKLSKLNTSNIRLFFGALLGSIYVLILILYPSLNFFYTTFSKFVLSLAIIAIAFTPEKIKSFLKALVTFYISTFIFAGAAFAFIYFNQSGGLVRNGIVYVFWNSKWTVLLLSIATVGIIIRIFWDLIQYKISKNKLLIPITISFQQKNIDIKALIDTGNSLQDPLSKFPVIVVEFKAIQDILPEEIHKLFDDKMELDLLRITDILQDPNWINRLRLIPFTSLGKENGMLIGFKPDYIEVGDSDEKKDINKVIVGIYNKKLSKSDSYMAILSPDLIAY